jgi:hypothetical protein
LNLDEVRIENLWLGDASADFLIRRDGSGAAVEVLRKRGDIEILNPCDALPPAVRVKTPASQAYQQRPTLKM